MPYSYEVNGTKFNSYRMSDKFYLFNNEGIEKSILNDEKRNPIFNEDSFAENNGKIYYALHNFELEKLIKENYVANLSF